MSSAEGLTAGIYLKALKAMHVEMMRVMLSTTALSAQISSLSQYINTLYGKGHPAPMDTNFSAEEFPLGIGSLTGIRYWQVSNSTGWHDISLRGTKGPWSEGENLASCLSLHAVAVPEPSPAVSLASWDAPAEEYYSPRPVTYRPHTFDEIPSQDCGCGFWAFWAPSPSVPGFSTSDVAGMVEGYGKYRAGTKGFRCSKARITALCVLDRGQGEDWRTRTEQALQEKYAVPIFSEVGTMLKAHPPSREGAPEPSSSGYTSGSYISGGSGYISGGWSPVSSWGIPQGKCGCPLCTRPVVQPPRVPCMTCHYEPATQVSHRMAGPLVFTCTKCPAARYACGCYQCVPNSQATLMLCRCGSVLRLSMPAGTAVCPCGQAYPEPAVPASPPQALAQLEKKKDPPS